MIIGLHDRLADVTSEAASLRDEKNGVGVGDIWRGERVETGWRVDTSVEFYDDGQTQSDESALGALAAFADSSVVAATSLAIGKVSFASPRERTGRQSVNWYDTSTGDRLAHEDICTDASRPARPTWLSAVPAFAHDEGNDPAEMGDLEVMCRLLPTPTSTPTATTTPSPTVTPSATFTRRPTSSATPTASTRPTLAPADLFLPLLLLETCTPDVQRMDVVLAIDASTSMLEPTSAARSKLDAAKAAARTFVGELGDSDQAAIVAFNSDARLLRPLTVDRDAIAAAIDGIEVASETCIPCAVEVATAELTSERRLDANVPVLILLTDGRSNPRPVSEAETLAEAAKRDGITIFTIGLGEDVDVEALARMASRPTFFYHAPDAEALAAIYAAIATEVPCPAGAYWGRR